MIALISPAKTLDFETPLPDAGRSSPRFAAEADRLALAAARFSAAELAELMKVSDKLGSLNAERFREFPQAAERPALFAFAGDVYAGFEVKSLEEDALPFAQDHLRILSGLYGLLRPLDAIRPYRLEMGTRWAPGKTKDLYGFWGARIADALVGDLEAQGDRILVNLASQEYWKVAAPHLPESVRVIDIDFREPGPKGLRFNTFAAKRARGMMGRYMVEHRLCEPEALKGFDSDGYRFDPDGSSDNSWRFLRVPAA